MPEDVQSNPHLDRILMAAIGAMAGLSMWGLIEYLPDLIENERYGMFLVAIVASFFAALLASIGPLPIKRALIVAGCVSLVPTVLLYWASFRFVNIDDFLSSGAPLLAYFILITIPVPFLIAKLGSTNDWRNYPELFTQSWGIFVRYAAAWLFVGAFWAILLLSMALFNLIGLGILEAFLEIDPVPFALTGAMLGLGLAVVNELSGYLSPFLLLRLLRLLLPIVLVVVAVFLLATPVRGLSGLFGSLSAAMILMAMAIGSVTLITSAIDQDEEDAISGVVMPRLTRALAMLLPFLSGLAVYAVAMRINQHGWSPNRIAAITVALFTFGYGVFYAGAVIRGSVWMSRIRSVNTYFAIALIVVSALWLTPLIDPQRISANSQLKRYAAGETDVEDVDVWTIMNDWGVAGEASIAKYPDARPELKAEITVRIEKAEKSSSRYNYSQVTEVEADGKLEELLGLLPVFPAGTSVPDDMFSVSSYFVTGGQANSWIESCNRRTPDGNPGCLLLLADFLPGYDGVEGMVIRKTNSGPDIYVETWRMNTSGGWNARGETRDALFDQGNMYDHSLIDLITNGEFEIAPAEMNALHIDGRQLIFSP